MREESSIECGVNLGSLSGSELVRALNRQKAGLPWTTTLGLVIEGLRVRLGRSVITLVAVVLAIGFLVQTSISGQVAGKLVDQVLLLESGKSVTDESIAKAQDLRNRLRTAGISVELRDQDEAQTRWLTVMALMVCTVGIANAMLMSVTERFWEIGTVKCLGANDFLIVRMFLIEAAAVGLLGAILGFVLGMALAGIMVYWQFGALATWPWRTIPIVFGGSALAGLVLAIFGAIYPVVLAARMKPVDALRIEE